MPFFFSLKPRVPSLCSSHAEKLGICLCVATFNYDLDVEMLVAIKEVDFLICILLFKKLCNSCFNNKHYSIIHGKWIFIVITAREHINILTFHALASLQKENDAPVLRNIIVHNRLLSREEWRINGKKHRIYEI